jgi:hypothetical protein
MDWIEMDIPLIQLRIEPGVSYQVDDLLNIWSGLYFPFGSLLQDMLNIFGVEDPVGSA